MEAVQKQLNVWASFWNKLDSLLEFNHGARYNRHLFDSTVGCRVSDGKIMFALKHQPVDTVDHSITLGATTAKTAWFHDNGMNQDNQIGSTIQTVNGVKLLCACSKSRLFVYRYNDLFDKLVPVDPNDNIKYTKGIKSNTAKSALVWKDTCNSLHFVTTFNGLACDGKNLIFKASTFADRYGTIVFPPGIETHYGHIIDPSAPYPGTIVRCYDLERILKNPPKNNEHPNKWCFYIPTMQAADIAGIQIYDNLVVSGCKQGDLYLIDKNTGKLVNTLVDPSGFTNATIADGVIYSYGGNNKWGGTTFGRDIYMWTPFGK